MTPFFFFFFLFFLCDHFVKTRKRPSFGQGRATFVAVLDRAVARAVSSPDTNPVVTNVEHDTLAKDPTQEDGERERTIGELFKVFAGIDRSTFLAFKTFAG